jgi:ribosome-associated heat shock protein Hsp15
LCQVFYADFSNYFLKDSHCLFTGRLRGELAAGKLQEMPATNSVRMDKWLWAARIFKTRSLASDACRQGRVTIAGLPVKASRDVKIADVIVVKKDELTRTFKVLQLLQHRVGAPAAKEYVEDQTPESELQKAREPRFTPLFFRPKGSGRPTKKERRAINDILESS